MMMTKPWNEYRSVIVRMYIDEGRTLTEVKDTMSQRYNFVASIRSYRQHFDQWHVGKYTCKKRDLRRKKALARQKALSPPRTPMIAGISAIINRRDEPATSPESLTRSSSISSSSSGASPASDSSPRSMDHRALLPSYYDDRSLRSPAIRSKAPQIRCLNAEGPATGLWEESDLNDALRTSNISNEILAYPLEATAINANKGSGRQLPAIYQESEWSRPPYYVHNKPSDYHRLPYHDTVPRYLIPVETSLSFPRSAEYQHPPESRTIPRLATVETNRVGRVTGD